MKKKLLTVTTYGLLFVAVLITLVPFYWAMTASTVPQSELFHIPPRMLPGTSFLQNLLDLQNRVNFLRSMFNSLFIAIVYTLLSVILCSLAGFGFAKYNFVGKKGLFYVVIGTLILPIQALVIPLYFLFTRMGLANSYLAIILPWAAHPFGIFLMRQNFASFPDSLLDSARLDGASEIQIFYKVVIPPMKSTLSALAIYLFMFQWNLYIWPLIILQDKNLYTVPVTIAQITGLQRVYFDQLMVATVLSALPVLLLFLLLQRQFIEGLLAGALK